MPRLGELLVAGGLCTAEQVDQALRAQVMWGGRLGTNLIEIGVLDLDQLSRTLGLQHGMPSALARHFEKIDKELQKLLSPDVAEKFSVVPLIKVGSGTDEKIVVATVGPLEAKPIAIVADDMGFPPEMIVVTVAAELRIRYQLERAYNIPRSTRFLRAKGPQFPQFTTAPDFAESSDVDIPPLLDTPGEGAPDAVPEELSRRATTPVVVQGNRPPQFVKVPPTTTSTEDAVTAQRPITIDDLSELTELDVEPDDDAEVEPEPTEEELKARRQYVKTLDSGAHVIAVPAVEEPSPPPPPPPREVSSDDNKALGRIALKRMVTPAPLPVELPRLPALGNTLGEATRSIRRATDRDRVVDLMMMTIEKFAPQCSAALLLVVRGDAAIGWRGFSRADKTFPEIAVPLDQAPLARGVVDNRTSARCECDDLGAIEALLFRALGGIEGDLILVPVVIGEQVMCIVAMIGSESSEVEAIASAGGAAFARLMRDASR